MGYRISRLQVSVLLIALVLTASVAAAQSGMILREGDQMTDLGTVRLWRDGDTTYVRGVLPQTGEMESTSLRISGFGGWTGRTKAETIVEGEITKPLKSVRVTLGYRHISRAQSRAPRDTCHIKSLPESGSGQAVVATFRLMGQEEVNCSQHSAAYWQIAEGPSRPLTAVECAEDRQYFGLPAVPLGTHPCDPGPEAVAIAEKDQTP